MGASITENARIDEQLASAREGTMSSRRYVATYCIKNSKLGPVVEMFLRAGEFIGNQEVLGVRLAIRKALGADLRTHNRPTCSEVAAIVLDNMGAERDIILHRQGSGLQRISDTHPAYDPLHFPLLFQYDELGWHLAVKNQGGATSYNSSRVSFSEFDAFRLYIKASGYSLLHRAARLFLREVSTLTTEMRVLSLLRSPGTSRLVFYNFRYVSNSRRIVTRAHAHTHLNLRGTFYVMVSCTLLTTF
jgi:hypothetical protein